MRPRGSAQSIPRGTDKPKPAWISGKAPVPSRLRVSDTTGLRGLGARFVTRAEGARAGKAGFGPTGRALARCVVRLHAVRGGIGLRTPPAGSPQPARTELIQLQANRL